MGARLATGAVARSDEVFHVKQCLSGSGVHVGPGCESWHKPRAGGNTFAFANSRLPRTRTPGRGRGSGRESSSGPGRNHSGHLTARRSADPSDGGWSRRRMYFSWLSLRAYTKRGNREGRAGSPGLTHVGNPLPGGSNRPGVLPVAGPVERPRRRTIPRFAPETRRGDHLRCVFSLGWNGMGGARRVERRQRAMK